MGVEIELWSLFNILLFGFIKAKNEARNMQLQKK